jgi:hypothetical protein
VEKKFGKPSPNMLVLKPVMFIAAEVVPQARTICCLRVARIIQILRVEVIALML